MESNARARTLGAELRDLRKAKGLSIVQFGQQVGLDKNMVSRNERGERVPSETEVASLLGALGVLGDKRLELLALAHAAAESNWLATGSGIPQQLIALIEYERIATFVMEVCPLVVPGLLQTADYARAIMVEGGVPHADIESRVQARLDRQRALVGETAVEYLVVIDEAVLRRPLGGRSVMAAQLRHLLVMAGRPNITARVVPRDRGWYPGLYGSFILLESARTTPVVHLEHMRASLFLDKVQDVQAFLDVKPTLLAASAAVEDSMELILRCAEEMEAVK